MASFADQRVKEMIKRIQTQEEGILFFLEMQKGDLPKSVIPQEEGTLTGVRECSKALTFLAGNEAAHYLNPFI